MKIVCPAFFAVVALLLKYPHGCIELGWFAWPSVMKMMTSGTVARP